MAKFAVREISANYMKGLIDAKENYGFEEKDLHILRVQYGGLGP
jgi:hypothetical protein